MPAKPLLAGLYKSDNRADSVNVRVSKIMKKSDSNVGLAFLAKDRGYMRGALDVPLEGFLKAIESQ